MSGGRRDESGGREGEQHRPAEEVTSNAYSQARVAAQVFVADLESLLLEPEDMHHLAKVLRLRDGELVIAGDGEGGWRYCLVSASPAPAVGRGAATIALRPAGPVTNATRETPQITICFALTKGDRPEWTVQKLTELGVDTLVPMITERTVARPAPAAARQRVERLRKVAREAAMQSRRRWLPKVETITELAAIIAIEHETSPCVAALGGAPPSLAQPFVLVGPEGGFSEQELEPLGPRHATIGLGNLTLRSETAAVAAGTLLGSLRSGLVGAVVDSAPAADCHRGDRD